MKKESDVLVIAGREFRSRLFLGTAGYPNRKCMLDAVAASGTEMTTASIRRISLAGDDESLVELLGGKVHFLPNTAGCQTARDAVLTAELAREALNTNWIKLEVIGDRDAGAVRLFGFHRDERCQRFGGQRLALPVD